MLCRQLLNTFPRLEPTLDYGLSLSERLPHITTVQTACDSPKSRLTRVPTHGRH